MTIPNEQDTMDRVSQALVGLSVCNCPLCQEQLRRGVEQEQREKAAAPSVHQAEMRAAWAALDGADGFRLVPQGDMFRAMNLLPDDRLAVFDTP